MIPIIIQVTKTVEYILLSNLRCIKNATTRINFTKENPNIAGTSRYFNASTSNHHTSMSVITANIPAIVQ